MRPTHIRVDAASTAEKVVTYCGAYAGSSVSAFHMREVAAGCIPPFPSSSVLVCPLCCLYATLRASHGE